MKPPRPLPSCVKRSSPGPQLAISTSGLPSPLASVSKNCVGRELGRPGQGHRGATGQKDRDADCRIGRPGGEVQLAVPVEVGRKHRIGACEQATACPTESCES